LKIKLTSGASEKIKLLRSLTLKPSLPILHNILVFSDNGTLKVAATDLETTIIFTLKETRWEGEDRFLLPAREISEILNQATEAKIYKEDANLAKVLLNGVKFEIALASVDDFPDLPSLGREHKCFSVPGGVFKKAIQKVVFATVKDTDFSPLRGVSLRSESLIASDGRILAIATISNQEQDTSCVISPKALSLLSKFLSNQNIDVYVGETTICFKTDDLFISTQLIAQKFPDISSILKEKIEINCLVEKNALKDMVRKASILAKDAANRVVLDFDKEKLLVSSASSVGNALGEVSVKVKRGNEKLPIKLGFNYAYLLSILERLEEDIIEIGLTDPESQTIWKGDKIAKYVLMPMKLR